MEPTATRPAAAPAPRRHHLVVDDNEDAALTLAALLQQLGHSCAAAFDGPSALAMAGAHHPDVALLDIGLPGMDGFELARRLRAMPGLANIRLVAVTGYGQASDRAQTTAAGFDAHVVKPARLAELLALLRRFDGGESAPSPRPAE